MKTLAFVLIGTIIGFGSAHAQQIIAGDDLKQLVTGKTVDFGAPGSATYKSDGKYEFYNKSNGATFRGKWSVQGDRLCVDFDSGIQRCDQYLRNGTNIVIKNYSGTTFPVTVK